MPNQLSLFGDVGQPVPSKQGGLFGANEIDTGFRHQGGVARNTAPADPGRSVFNRRQQSFDFSKKAPWSVAANPARVSMGKRAARALKAGGKAMGPLGVALELAFIPAIAAGGVITGSAAWGSQTGMSEDYVGGAVYGGARGIGAGIGGAAGGIAGGVIGGAIGSVFGPIGTGIGAAVGGITGNLVGESVGGKLLNDPAQRLGMAARAISRTARATDRVQFGGNFVDSRGAYTMRQNAVQEMSGSMLNARQFLGNEAIFLHER